MNFVFSDYLWYLVSEVLGVRLLIDDGLQQRVWLIIKCSSKSLRDDKCNDSLITFENIQRIFMAHWFSKKM